jgi:hypothetical protein
MARIFLKRKQGKWLNTVMYVEKMLMARTKSENSS